MWTGKICEKIGLEGGGAEGRGAGGGGGWWAAEVVFEWNAIERNFALIQEYGILTRRECML